MYDIKCGVSTLSVFVWWLTNTDDILKFPTPCILAVNRFILFQLNTQNMLNTYIYHQLPPTCFGVCYTTFRETIALFAQKAYTYVTYYAQF